MSKGRLTRQELGWLLTQEAQGAAERLRSGVQVLKGQGSEATPELPKASDSQPDLVNIGADGSSLDATLDALDDAMRVLSSIHHKPVTSRGRRGRVDLAALLWEVAPEARVAMNLAVGPRSMVTKPNFVACSTS